MSPYATELASARLNALRTLIDALNEADTPEEKRRCAVAIFNAPDPCNLDDEIELKDDEDDEVDDNHAAEVETPDRYADSQHDHLPEGNAPTPHDPESALSSAIQDHMSRIPPVILARLTDDELIARSIALYDSGTFNHLVAPP